MKSERIKTTCLCFPPGRKLLLSLNNRLSLHYVPTSRPISPIDGVLNVLASQGINFCAEPAPPNPPPLPPTPLPPPPPPPPPTELSLPPSPPPAPVPTATVTPTSKDNASFTVAAIDFLDRLTQCLLQPFRVVGDESVDGLQRLLAVGLREESIRHLAERKEIQFISSRILGSQHHFRNHVYELLWGAVVPRVVLLRFGVGRRVREALLQTNEPVIYDLDPIFQGT